MTNFATKIMMAAATLAVAAGAASAQTLKAEIPFAFRVGNTVMAAGNYEVSQLTRHSGSPVYRIRDARAEKAITLLPQAASDPSKTSSAKGQPVLAFDCVADHCALASIWTGPGSPAYKIR